MRDANVKLTDIDFKIAENRKLLSLPPASSRHLITAGPLPGRDHSLQRTSTIDSTDSKERWRCIIA